MHSLTRTVAVGNTIGVSLHLVGFAEAIASMYAPSTVFFDLDVQLWAAVGLIVLIAIALRGVGPIIRFNLFLLFLMTISIFTFFVGTFIPNESKSAVGFTGYSSKTFGSNWGPQYLPGQDFLSLVAVFFPSVTGCMAGANISGDLKKPSVNIPVGTLWAVAVSMTVYVAIAWVLGATVIRNEVDSVTGELVDGVGLQSEYTIMSQIAAWRPLVDLGILASTFSSATSCFVAAPRILKAVCDDGLFPLLSPLAVGRRRDNEPVRCYWLVAAVCLLVLVVSGGDIVWIAPLVTNFFLVTYGLVNYSVFQWAWSKSPGWRPTFKYHSGSLSLFAAAQSVALMVLIDWAMALATLALAVVAYKYIEWRQLDTNWGTTVESNLYVKGCRIALKYQAMNTEHAKIARPTFLMMLYDHNANDIETLYGFVQHFNFGEGLVVIGHVLIGSLRNEAVRADFLRKKKSFREYALSPQIARKCIMECCIAANYGEGTRTMLQLAGMGGMRPNVFVLRLGDDPDSESNVDSNDNERDRVPLWFTNLQYAMLSGLGIMAFPKRFQLDPIEPVDDSLNVDEVKTVDIWWLFDDGGLTLLMGHLLTKRDRFRNHKLRIMALDESGFEHQSGISSLIEKMRIEAQIKHIVTAQDVDVNGNGNGNEEDNEEMARYRRIGKSIARHSNDADLCLLTMPYPRDEFKWWEFERILDDLTPKDVPTIFVRGTEHQVLTFFF